MTETTKMESLDKARQVFAVLTAFTLPLSTSGQAISVTIFVALAILTLERPRFLATIRTPAAYLPVVIFAAIVIGVLWSTQPYSVAIKWVSPYAKLLLIPLVMSIAFTTKQARQVGYGFLAACLILLVLAWSSFLWPSGPWTWFKSPGVPVKDNAVQSGCFALCAFGLAVEATHRANKGHRRFALAIAVLSLAFLAAIFLIYISKTGVIIAVALLGLFLVKMSNWRDIGVVAILATIVIGVTLVSSAPAQRRLAEISVDFNPISSKQELGSQASQSSRNPEAISTASRLDFWKKAVGFIENAPFLGYGTGSIKQLYQGLEVVRPSPYGEATPDPHNQFFHVALQIGLIGGGLLIAMWVAHWRMFSGCSSIEIMGQAIVLQNVIGSLFNSHLTTVTQGMIYCLAVGVLAAVTRPASRDSV